MNRDEARNRLAGTFRFRCSGDQVYVDDQALLEEIARLKAEPGHTEVPPRLAVAARIPQAAFMQAA